MFPPTLTSKEAKKKESETLTRDIKAGKEGAKLQKREKCKSIRKI